MSRWIALAVLVGVVLSFPAVAQDSGAGQADSILYVAQKLLLLLGLAFAGYWAYSAFNAPPIHLGDGPTPPRYMTQPKQYQLGAVTFTAICLLLYSLIAYFHKEFFPLVGSVVPPLRDVIETSTKADGSIAYPTVVVLAAASFVALLKLETDWNPLLILRHVVHGWVAIPQLANALMVMARDELVVPADARAAVAGDPESPHVALGDFEKDRRSLDRRWAELCYIRLWLERYRAQGSHLTFFTEPSFAWEALQEAYDNARVVIGPLKRGKEKDPRVFADVAGKIDTLRRKYCRLAACFLVFKNQTQKNAIRDARQFGVTIAEELECRANPLRYIAIFLVALIFAIYIGVLLSVTLWDVTHGAGAATAEDPDLITRWIGYGLTNYGTAIAAILLLRYLGWNFDPGQPNSYLVSYATIFLVALCVSTPSLSLAIKLAGTGPIAKLPYLSIVFASIKWSVSPALVAVYVVYHVDRQIDPLMPDIGPSDRWRLPHRLAKCIFFAILVALFSTPPALALAGSAAAVPLGKTRLMIIGTTLAVGLIMALVGEFCLVKPAALSGDTARRAAIG